MMSGQEYENMAVVGQVSDIVQAFREAASYLRRIKERRKSRPPPRGLVVDSKALQDLEFSLSRGQDVVRGHYERDYRRLGQPFATGDLEAIDQLKEILSDLQRGLVSGLKFAYQHDQHVDFLPLQDVADQCSDRVIMSLMQLHQRVLMDSNARDIASASPYRQPLETMSRPPVNPPRPVELSLPPPDMTTQLLTPRQSPSHELSRYIPISPPPDDKNPPRRPQALEMWSNGSQNSINTPLTPPLDSAIGPPPSIPLPPLPKDVQERKRRAPKAKLEERTPVELPEKESHSPVNMLDDTIEHAWKEEELRGARAPTTRQPEFQDPHPGTLVDPSKIGSPVSPRLSPSPTSVYPAPLRTKASASRSPTNSPAFLVPPKPNEFSGSPTEPHAISSGRFGNTDQRESVVSSVTMSSFSGSSVSAMSRQTSGSSTTSQYPRQANDKSQGGVHGMSGNTHNTRNKLDVPEAIDEAPGHSESQASIKPLDVWRQPTLDTRSRPSSSMSQPQQHNNGSFSLFPPPPIPAFVARSDSAPSIRSNQSSVPPAPMPIRTIQPASLDASDSKLHLPSEANKFGGLCKSAWRAQIGLLKKAYSAEKKPGGMVATRTVDYIKCRGCDFSGRVALGPKGKKGPDRVVIISKDTGLAYRWDFLFKSHLPVKGGVTSAEAEYGCMFCCAEGRGTPIYKGMSAFIAHVSEHRPGVGGHAVNPDLHVPEGPVCDRMDALVGRIMDHDDRWEIAFPRASGEGVYSDAASVATGANDYQSMRSGATSRAY